MAPLPPHRLGTPHEPPPRPPRPSGLAVPLLLMGRRQDTVAVLAGQYAARFRETLRPLRMIGREAEFPLVYPDGRAGDVFRLWEPLLAKGGFEARYDDAQTRTVIVALTGAGGTIEVGVGRATAELGLGPYEDLWQLAEGTHRLLQQVAEVAHEVGMRVLGDR